jgi:hypothetical protein
MIQEQTLHTARGGRDRLKQDGRRISRLCILVLAAAVAWSATARAANKYAGEFLTHGVGARALGMGSAFVAVADDVTAGYWNPAGAADAGGSTVQLMHSETFGGVINYDTAAFVRPLEGGGAIGLTVIRLSIDDIPFTDFEEDEDRIIYDASRITWESDAESAMFVTYARPLSTDIRVGGNLKMIRKSVGNFSCYGLGFDLGAKYDVWKGPGELTLGANLQDVTTTILVWDTKMQERIMPTAKLGLAYAQSIPSMDSRVTAAADADFRFENRLLADEYHVGSVTADTHYGLELVYKEMVAVRAGLAMGQLTAGAGVRLGSFTADYALGKHEYLDSSHRVSASYLF